jgi:hypothetical protein
MSPIQLQTTAAPVVRTSVADNPSMGYNIKSPRKPDRDRVDALAFRREAKRNFYRSEEELQRNRSPHMEEEQSSSVLPRKNKNSNKPITLLDALRSRG